MAWTQPRTLLLAGLTAIALGAPASACAGGQDPTGIVPLGSGDAQAPRAPASGTDATGAPTTGAPHGGPPGAGPASEPPGASGERAAPRVRRELADLLDRYDEAISALAADPLAAGDDGHPLTRDWLSVVAAGSGLDEEVRWRILTDGRDNRLRLLPDATGTTYRNTAGDVTVQPDGTVHWANCGYAPGVEVDLDTGEVLDDRRATTRGRGTAVRGPDGRLVLSWLADERIDVLEPGVPDPCAEPTGDDR